MPLWELFIVCRLYYGNHRVNKLTFRPLWWTAVKLICQLAYFIGFTFYGGNNPKIFDDGTIYLRSDAFNYFLLPLNLVFIYCDFGFLSSIIYEQQILLVYILFQRFTEFN
jgi:hypothetical protein